MPSDAPLISVCIPAYNRAALLGALLDSVYAQDFHDFEVVICEDASPEREAIRAVAEAYAARHPGTLRYFENERNLGYDGNFRMLIGRAAGEYVCIMGNDDLMCPGALRAIASVVRRHPDVGVVLRSFAMFDGTPANIVSTSRYFPDERRFEAGPDAVVAFFRRLVAMSGIVLHRESAAGLETDRFDGSLFYQQYLGAHILARRPGVFVPDVLVLFRKDGVPEFGMADAERGRFTPGRQPPDTDLRMIRALLDIARDAEQRLELPVYRAIVWDFGNYAYPTLAHQAHEPLRVFARFYLDLARLGLWRSPLFHAYFVLVLTLGRDRLDRVIGWARRRLGHTPVIGRGARGMLTPRGEASRG